MAAPEPPPIVIILERSRKRRSGGNASGAPPTYVYAIPGYDLETTIGVLMQQNVTEQNAVNAFLETKF